MPSEQGHQPTRTHARDQVIISELYSGYPAQQSGRIFMGDVVTSINGVKVTDVEMAAQIIKLTAGAQANPNPTPYPEPRTRMS